MCWRCVADSVPYVAGSAGMIRFYGARLGRRSPERVGDEAVDVPTESGNPVTPATPEGAAMPRGDRSQTVGR